MKPRITLTKTLIFWALSFIPLVLMLEVLSWKLCDTCVPSRIRARIGKDDPRFFVHAREKISRQQDRARKTENKSDYSDLKMFHPLLGWDYPAGTEYRDGQGIPYHHGPSGERRTCTSYTRDLIVTYGDSFTYCADVPDDQTWQTHLARSIGFNVINYGVGGYGTDQAYLKFLYHRSRSSVPITVLGILPENINRVVNIYRLFYNFDDPLALTKPRYEMHNGSIKLHPNPIQRIQDLRKLEDPAFLEKLGQHDYWFQLARNLPYMGFPYCISAIRWRKPIMQDLLLTMHRLLPSAGFPSYPWNLFDQPEPFSIMCHIVDLFVQKALSRKSQPVVLILPHRDYIREMRDHGVSRAEPLTKYLKIKKYAYLDLIEEFAKRTPTDSDLDKWYRGHATAEGNTLVAEMIGRYLKHNNMLSD